MRKILFLSGFLLILDQITKYFFTGKHIELLSFFHLTYVENTGAAFGLFKGFNILFILITLVVIATIFYYFKEHPLSLSLILAGALGNLLDRLIFGFVRDFIAVGIWPVFNLADAFSTVGVILLIYELYHEDKAYKRRRPKKF